MRKVLLVGLLLLTSVFGVSGRGTTRGYAAQVDPSTLALPASEFADFTPSENGSVDASGASRGPFANNHLDTYQALGMQSGYQQGGTLDFETIHYLVSSYSTANGANNSLTDGQNHTSGLQGAISQPCHTMRFASSCTQFTYPAASGGHVTYIAAQVGICLVEVQGSTPATEGFEVDQTQNDAEVYALDAVNHTHLACPNGVPAAQIPKTGALKACTTKTVSKKVKGKTKHVKVKQCTTSYGLFTTLAAPDCGGGYDTQNAGVTIRDENNKVIATSTTSAENVALETGTLDCIVWFYVKVPKANFYQLQIGTHTGAPYTFAQLQQAHWYLKLSFQ